MPERTTPRTLSTAVLSGIVAVAVVVGGIVATTTAVAVVAAGVVTFGGEEQSTSAASRASGSTPQAPAVPSPVPTPSASTPAPTPSAVPPTTRATPSPAATSRPSAPAPKPSTGTSSPPKGAAAAAALLTVVGVVDGDTIKVRVGGTTERVRVIGIDTPELRTRECYAQQASSRMQSLVQSKKVRLVRDPTQADRDRYDRLLRHVQLADGRQVARILIAGGYGEEYTYDRAYSGQATYRAAEQAARKAGKGIWSSGCLAPPPAATGACVIKGNVARGGERIYHLPGQQYYEVTQVDESKGERWFCSESDAVSAGWRRSKR